MDAAGKDEAMTSFMAITGASQQQARFYLDLSAWDVQAAISNFFDHNGVEVSAGAAPGEAATAHDQIDDDDDDDYDPEDEDTSPPVVPSVPPAAPAPAQQRQPPRIQPAGNIRGFGNLRGGGNAPTRRGGGSGSNPRIRSFSELSGGGGGGGGGSDSDEDDPLEYYTGGEKSGMMVQDPQHGKDPVESLFERARQHGAVEGGPADLVPGRSGPSRPSAFSGTARTLSGAATAPQQAAPQQAGPPPPSVHTIVFYRNGFTVDDGPLRRLDDPANRSFLDSINRGERPRELEPADHNVPVHVNLVRRMEDYVPPPEPKYRAFAGTARTLAGSSDSTQQVTELPPPPPSSNAPTPQRAPSSALHDFKVDDSKPVTTLQLRLHDGTRMVARFNHTHTVGDIRRFIEHAQPGVQPAGYRLVTAFPAKELSDASQSIEDAGLVNAVVIQKV
eukprot:jgi/Chlat1/7086/Chrsp57S06786